VNDSDIKRFLDNILLKDTLAYHLFHILSRWNNSDMDGMTKELEFLEQQIEEFKKHFDYEKVVQK
jgi:hypothetical protein